jgi:hypothetical protein
MEAVTLSPRVAVSFAAAYARGAGEPRGCDASSSERRHPHRAASAVDDFRRHARFEAPTRSRPGSHDDDAGAMLLRLLEDRPHRIQLGGDDQIERGSSSASIRLGSSDAGFAPPSRQAPSGVDRQLTL